VNRIMKSYSLIIVSLAALVLVVVFGQARAMTVATNSITLTSEASENTTITGGYKYYPESVSITPAGSTTAVTKTLRGYCSEGVYKSLPWLGFKDGVVSNDTANQMTSSGSCSNRYTDGGPDATTKGWMPPEAYGGWALRGVLSGTPAFGGRTWTDAMPLGSAAGIYSDKFSLLSSAEKQTDVIWAGVASTNLPTADQAGGDSGLFRKNGHPSYTNYTNEKLLSSGTTYFRNEFTLTADQVSRLKNMTLDVRADDFANVFINGVVVPSQQRTTSCPVGIACIKKTSDITGADLAAVYHLQEGDNVLAIQVNDKASWADNVGGSNSNAVGLWYKAVINLNDPVVGTNSTLTVQDNPDGVATLVGGVTVTTGSTVLKSTIGYTLTDTSYTFSRWEGDCSGTGAHPDSDILMNSDKTCTARFTQPTLTCSVNPPSGETPLVVKVVASTTGITIPSFSYNMGDSSTATGKPSTFWYTYSNAGTYAITVSSPLYRGGAAVPCTTTAGDTLVKVTSPTGGNGGEVRP